MALTIQPEQMSAFEARAREKFYADAVGILRQRQPKGTAVMSDEELLAYVKKDGQRAEALGLKEDPAILQFLELGVLPEDFRQAPLVREVVARVLANDDLPIAARVAFLHAQIVARAKAKPSM